MNDDSRQLGEEEESCLRQTRLIFVCVGPSIKNESWKMKSSALHAQLIVLIIFMLQHLDPLQRSVLLFVAEHNLPIGIIDNYTRVTGGGPIFNILIYEDRFHGTSSVVQGDPTSVN